MRTGSGSRHADIADNLSLGDVYAGADALAEKVLGLSTEAEIVAALKESAKE